MCGLNYMLSAKPVGQTYRRLIECLAELCDVALLVVRDGVSLSADGRQVLDRLAPFLIGTELSAEWPGTRLSGREARVYRYSLSPGCVAVLENGVYGLFDWQQPGRPEDLCLLRNDGSAVLTSIAHEEDCFVTLSDEDLAAVHAKCPDIHRLLVREDEQ
jgi:hypothetical protein